ncbi:MAG TPA: DUF1707 domain-containing protein [Mycobacteriales bacterium]|nr:DUF1707 domain-containing protein [Mycobacteriales bacterium]
MDPSLRASDDDRERVVARLREHCAQGRPSVEEFKERLDAAYAARTVGELALLTRDLPEEGSHPLARPEPPRPPACRDRSVVAWATASAVSVTVWLVVVVLTGNLWGLWPLWVLGPWGAVLLARALTGGAR